MITAAEALLRQVLRVCPTLDEGALDVLAALGPDLPPERWAAILDAPIHEVRRAMRILGVA